MITEVLLVQEAGAPFSYQEITVNDNLRDDEVLVEMKATGVCRTDLNFSKEKTIPELFPAVFGHEGKISNYHGCCHNQLAHHKFVHG
jgi:aryl-alcohol dehydrogenase